MATQIGKNGRSFCIFLQTNPSTGLEGEERARAWDRVRVRVRVKSQDQRQET
jgi:hypothetical protein